MNSGRKTQLVNPKPGKGPGRLQTRLAESRTAQLKTIAPSPLGRSPAAPPPYRPLPVPRVLQGKISDRQHAFFPKSAGPAAPAVYRPMPLTKVLQSKIATGRQPPSARAQPDAPPIYRPAGNVLQSKVSPSSKAHQSSQLPPIHPPAIQKQLRPTVSEMRAGIVARNDSAQRQTLPRHPQRNVLRLVQGKTAKPSLQAHPNQKSRSAFPDLRRAVRSAPVHFNASATTIQPGLWDWLTSCFRRCRPAVENHDGAHEDLIGQQVQVVVHRPVSNQVLVDQGNYGELEEGTTYFPGHLTSCAMVFAIGRESGCVFHWPFHAWVGSHVRTMKQAMGESGVNGAVRYQIFGMDAPKGSDREKSDSDWRDFRERFKLEFGEPEVILIEEPYTNPLLRYSDGSVTTFFNRRVLE